MTDYAHDLLRDEPADAEPPVPVRVIDRRRVTADRLAAVRAAGNQSGRAREVGREQAPPQDVARGQGPAPDERTRLAGAPGPGQRAPRRPLPEPAGPEQPVAVEPAARTAVPVEQEARTRARAATARADSERRAALLATTVVALARQPATADVDALLAAHVDAPAPDVEQAARTVTAVYLRAPAGLRGPLRAVLAPAVARHRGTALAERLAVRLAGGAMPPAPAPSATPEPPVEGGPSPSPDPVTPAPPGPPRRSGPRPRRGQARGDPP